MLTAALSTDQAAVRVPAKPYSSVPVAACHACRGQPPRVVGVHHRQLPARCAGGTVGKAVAKYFGEEPHQQLDDDLRRLKQVLETGEVVRSDGAPWGKRARKEFPQRPAQPLSDSELAKGADE